MNVCSYIGIGFAEQVAGEVTQRGLEFDASLREGCLVHCEAT